MKRYSHQLISWWFAIMVPSYAPLTTIDERERVRKRRLLSSSVLLNLTAVSLFCLQGFFTGASMLQQLGSALGCCLALFVLWINKRDHLKMAGLLHTFFTSFIMVLIISILSLKNPISSFYVWAMLPIIPVMAGLFLPAWGPLLLTIFEIVFMNWFILSGRHSQIATSMTASGLRIQFIFFSCMVIFVTGILSAIYATTTKKAVIQADRAIELEQAHQALSEAYVRLEQAHTTIQKQALTDGLTGLPNHRAIMDQLVKELDRAGRYDHPFSSSSSMLTASNMSTIPMGMRLAIPSCVRSVSEQEVPYVVEIRWDALEARSLSFSCPKQIPLRQVLLLSASVQLLRQKR